MIVYDDLEQSEKIKVYDKGITLDRKQDPEKIYQVLVGYRTGDMLAPNLDMKEALAVEAAHFVRCVEQKERPITDGIAGLRVVEVLEAASQSMGKRGHPVELPSAVAAKR
jgi:predicted dehydrogenase